MFVPIRYLEKWGAFCVKLMNAFVCNMQIQTALKLVDLYKYQFGSRFL